MGVKTDENALRSRKVVAVGQLAGARTAKSAYS